MKTNPIQPEKPGRFPRESAPDTKSMMPVFIRDFAIIGAGLVGVIVFLRFIVALVAG